MRLGLGLGIDVNRRVSGGAAYDYLLSGDGDAEVAYSLRAVNPDYTGAIVLIRRSSDNAEKAFYKDADNLLSLSSEDGASVSLSTWIGSDNGFVKTWYDQSGNSKNPTQGTAGNQPRLVELGNLELSGGKVAVRFVKANNQRLTILDTTANINNMSSYFVGAFAVYSALGGVGYSQLLSIGFDEASVNAK